MNIKCGVKRNIVALIYVGESDAESKRHTAGRYILCQNELLVRLHITVALSVEWYDYHSRVNWPLGSNLDLIWRYILSLPWRN